MAHISVPASCANLGAGFDCVALAVDRRLEVSAIVTHGASCAVTIQRSGTITTLDIPAEKDLLYLAFCAAAERGHKPFNGQVHFSATSHIPIARGLGSSAAAIVAGAVLANETLALGLDRDKLLEVCVALEGHADNVAAALYGGAVLTVLHPGASHTVTRLAIHDSLAFVFSVPDFETETKLARGVLPPVLPFSRAVLGAARAASLVQGLATGDGALLALAFDDVLHVPYRRSLVSGFDEIALAATTAGAYGATLSGSGSSVVSVTHRDSAENVRNAMLKGWADLGIGCEAFTSIRHPVPGIGVFREEDISRKGLAPVGAGTIFAVA